MSERCSPAIFFRVDGAPAWIDPDFLNVHEDQLRVRGQVCAVPLRYGAIWQLKFEPWWELARQAQHSRLELVNHSPWKQKLVLWSTGTRAYATPKGVEHVMIVNGVPAAFDIIWEER